MPKKPLSSKPIKKQTLADQMAGAIQQAILSGELESGAALPTEPDLAGQFGVSRAVVRDATRILMAQGLVEVKHGRGVFVTPPQNEAFGEALLLALRRAGATVWDVEQFEQIIFPEVVALAATTASDEEIGETTALDRRLPGGVCPPHAQVGGGGGGPGGRAGAAARRLPQSHPGHFFRHAQSRLPAVGRAAVKAAQFAHLARRWGPHPGDGDKDRKRIPESVGGGDRRPRPRPGQGDGRPHDAPARGSR